MGLKQSHRKRDSLLVQNAVAGDQKAYSELMSLYWTSIEKTLSLKLVSKEDVEDLTIATFSKAFDKLDSYDDSFAFSTWIQTIASNNLIDFFRKKIRKQFLLINKKKMRIVIILMLLITVLIPKTI